MKRLFALPSHDGLIGKLAICILAFFIAQSSSGNASQKKEARVTQVIQDVKLLVSNAAPRPATINDNVQEGTAVRTGQASRTELTFSDQTLTRLGANSVFSFNVGAGTFDLRQGSILMQVPPNGSTATVKTAAVTAAVTGGTALFGVGPPTKFMVLEGTGTFYPAGHPEEAVTLHGGEMVTLTPDGHIIGPTGFNVETVLETSELLVGFPDLANLPLILEVMMAQRADNTNGFKYPPKDTTEVVDQKNAASTPTPSTSPTPTGSPIALKFGPPSTITSPVPYVINSTTVINTDPTITTDGTTNNGTIYRNPTDDGPRATWMFGSTSTFDTTSGFADGFDSPNMNNMAVFKFTSLQITGNPTVNITGDNAVGNLGLIGVNGITTGGSGGTLTFDNVGMLLLATQNGSINLGPEVSFSGLDRMHIYARGTGSNLTIGSAISTNNDLRLYSEGTVTTNGNLSTINFSSFSGGDFLGGTGVITANGVYITSLGNISVDGEKIPDLPDGGGSISLTAANTLNIVVAGGTNTRESFFAKGTTINLTSDSPVVLTLSATTPTFIGGSGGIIGPNVGLVGADMEISTTDGGNIHLYSVGVANSTLTGFVHAAGSFTAQADVTTNELTAGTFISIGTDTIVGDMTAGTTIDVVGRLAAFGTVTAGGNITAGTVAVPTIEAPAGILTETSGGILPFIEDSSGPNDGAMIQHTFNVLTVHSPNGIDFSGNQFNGIDGFSSGGLLTINATTQTFGEGGIAFANFNGADVNGFPTNFPSGGPATAGNGGTFIVNTTGDITTVVGADITATTGLNPDALTPIFSGTGGTVELNSSAGTVTVDSTILVSSSDTPDGPYRSSASGGTILLQSHLTTGTGITVGTNGALLSYLSLDAVNADGTPGSITLSTMGADIVVNGTVRADFGTITIDQNDPPGPTPTITLDGATVQTATFNINGSGDLTIGPNNATAINIFGGTWNVAHDITLNAANTTFAYSFALNAAAGNAINFTGGNSDVAATLALPLSGNTTFTAGTGGINAQFVDIFYSGAELNLTSGGDITAHSIKFTDSIARGTVNAVGAITTTGDLWEGVITAGTSVDVGGSISISTLSAGGTVTAGGYISAKSITAGGDITADNTHVQFFTSPTGVLSVANGISPYVFITAPGFPQGAAAPHIYTVESIVSPNGIDFSGNQFDGIAGLSSGGLLTINATTQIFGDGGIAFANFNGADVNGFPTGFPDGGPAEAGDGGTFIVNATGNITTVLGADITATTGLNGPEDHGFAGNGGNVTLNSSGGTVTVDSLIQVSSNDGISEGGEPIRRSASGGNITLHSGLTTGLGVSIGGNAQLLSLLNHNAPGPGGTILITTDGADIHMGEFSGAFLIADRGTIDVHQTAPGSVGTSLIEIYNTFLRAETISIASSGDFELGVEGFVFVDGVTLSLTAANDLTMDGISSGATAIHSDGNVTISAGNNLSILSDLDITRTNNGRDSGVNITLSAAAAMSVTGTLTLTTAPDGLISGGNILVTASTINITGDTLLTTNTLENAGTGGNITVTGDLTTRGLIANVLVGQFTARPIPGPLGFPDVVTLTSGGNITVTAPNGLTLSSGVEVPGSALLVSTAVFGEILTGGNITLDVGSNDGGSLTSDAPFEMEIDNSDGGHIGTGANISATVHGNFSVSDLFVAIFNGGGSIDNGGKITFSIDNTLTTTNDASFIIDHSDASFIPAGTAISVTASDFSIGGDLNAYIDDSIEGGPVTGTTGTVTITSHNGMTVTGRLNVLGNVIAELGDITAGTIASTNVTSPTAIHALAGGIARFSISGDLFPEVLHTLTAPVVTSTGGINFNGLAADGDFSMATNAGALTINANSLSIGSGPGLFGPLAFLPANIVGPVTFNGGDGSSTFDPASGGTFTVNTTGAITVNSDIEATTGHFPSAPSATPAGFGGTVNLNSTTGTVTVNSRIEVSSAEPASTIAPFRQSNKGGNIKITSGKAGGSAITVGSTARLLSLLDASATGGGGKIELSATGDGSSIDVNNTSGRIEADQGTIDINHQGNNGIINISNANMIADVIKAEIFGTGGTLTIGGGSIDASSALTMYAASSNGSIIFNASVTLNSGATAAIIAANTVTINNGVTVTIGGSVAAQVYANVRNYDVASGGTGGSFGSFGGAGATSQPFVPGNPPLVAKAGTVGSQFATSGSGALTAASQTKSGPVTVAQSSALKTSLATKPVTSRVTALPSRPHQLIANKPVLNVANSGELLAQLESATESGGKINVVAKSQPRNRLQTSTRRGNVVRNGNVARPAVTNTTSIALVVKGPMTGTTPVNPASARTLSY